MNRLNSLNNLNSQKSQEPRIYQLMEEIAAEINSIEKKNRDLYASAVDIEDEQLSIQTQTESYKVLRNMRGLKASMNAFKSQLEKSGILLNEYCGGKDDNEASVYISNEHGSFDLREETVGEDINGCETAIDNTDNDALADDESGLEPLPDYINDEIETMGSILAEMNNLDNPSDSEESDINNNETDDFEDLIPISQELRAFSVDSQEEGQSEDDSLASVDSDFPSFEDIKFEPEPMSEPEIEPLSAFEPAFKTETEESDYPELTVPDEFKLSPQTENAELDKLDELKEEKIEEVPDFSELLAEPAALAPTVENTPESILAPMSEPTPPPVPESTPTPEPAPEQVVESTVEPIVEQTAAEPKPEDDFSGFEMSVPDVGIYSNRTPGGFVMFGRRVDVKGWSEMLVKVCEILILKNPYTVAQFDKYHDLNPFGNCYFSYNQGEIKNMARKLSNGLWIEINRTPDDIVMLCKKVLELCGYPRSELEIEFND